MAQRANGSIDNNKKVKENNIDMASSFSVIEKN